MCPRNIAHLYSKLQYKMGHCFLDRQYRNISALGRPRTMEPPAGNAPGPSGEMSCTVIYNPGLAEEPCRQLQQRHRHGLRLHICAINVLSILKKSMCIIIIKLYYFNYIDVYEKVNFMRSYPNPGCFSRVQSRYEFCFFSSLGSDPDSFSCEGRVRIRFFLLSDPVFLDCRIRIRFFSTV